MICYSLNNSQKMLTKIEKDDGLDSPIKRKEVTKKKDRKKKRERVYMVEDDIKRLKNKNSNRKKRKKNKGRNINFIYFRNACSF